MAEQPRLATAFAAAILLSFVAAALFAPKLAPYDPAAQNLALGLAPPSAAHPLGCDKLGRDELSRLLYGARVSLFVAVVAVAANVALGTLVGAVAGYFGGALDFWLMRVVDVVMAFPGILLAIAISAVLGPSIGHVVLALAAIGWTGYARLVRGEVLRIKGREHVVAARALGASRLRILQRHVLPLAWAPVIVQATFGMAGVIVAEASLSFLGLGVQPPTPSWGAMVNDGRPFLLVAPHMTVFPGLAIVATVLALNILGDTLRDRLDVRAS
ncbi:MAG: ABC transporter permease [Candidatus Dadabacteria bacterium]|nr:MAG: ABC transporter permease [Candidatus Dadabacteria bacterium]